MVAPSLSNPKLPSFFQAYGSHRLPFFVPKQAPVQGLWFTVKALLLSMPAMTSTPSPTVTLEDYLQAQAGGNLASPQAVAQALVDKDAEIAQLRQALVDQRAKERFEVQVATYKESCGTSYLVQFLRPDRLGGPSVFDPGVWTLEQMNNPDHANEEAEQLRRFFNLDIPVTELED